MRICIVDLATNLVVNVGEFGENLPAHVKQPAQPPAGFAWIEHPTAGVGWRLEGGVLVNPAPPPPPPTAEELAAQARANTDEAERITAKANAPMMAFLNMTKAQSDAWIDANVTDPGTRVALKVLGSIAKHAARGRMLR